MKLREIDDGIGHIYWRADLGMVNGKRVQKQFQTKSAAEAFLSAKRTESKNGGTEALAMPHGDRVAFIAARGKLAERNATIADAVDFYLKHHQRGAARKTLRETIDECVEQKRGSGKRERYIRQLSHTLNNFALTRELKQCSEISHDEIEAWLNGNGWATATRRSHLSDVKTLFSFCLRRGYISLNPCVRIEPIMLEDKAPGILKVDECRRLLDTARKNDKGLLPYLAIGLFCGIRPAEIEQLTWKQVDVKRGLIEVEAHKSKTRRRRFVTISENCKAWLKLKGSLPPRNVVKRLRRIRKLAKVEWPHDCMRHSFASYHLAEHQSQDKTAHELGHGSTQMLFAHYRELVTQDEASKFWELRPK